jgi:hypothetical protein
MWSTAERRVAQINLELLFSKLGRWRPASSTIHHQPTNHQSIQQTQHIRSPTTPKSFYTLPLLNLVIHHLLLLSTLFHLVCCPRFPTVSSYAPGGLSTLFLRIDVDPDYKLTLCFKIHFQHQVFGYTLYRSDHSGIALGCYRHFGY